MRSQELNSGATQSFSVDHVIAPGSTQQEVFERGGVPGLVQSVLQGYNATVFAYGQTGSGKTFTMEGYDYRRSASGHAIQADFDASPDRLGLTPRAVTALFKDVHAHNEALSGAEGASAGASPLRVVCHFCQIYKEAVLDLLNPAPPSQNGAVSGLKIRWSADRQFYVR